MNVLRSALSRTGGGGGCSNPLKELSPPSGLNFTPAFKVFEKGTRFYSDISEENHLTGTPVEYWVNSETGNNSNDGLSLANPMKTLAAVLALGNHSIINIVGTFYWTEHVPINGRWTDHREIALIAGEGGCKLLGAHHQSDYTWADEGSGAYSTTAPIDGTVTGVTRSDSVDSYGIHTALLLRTSLAEVQSDGGYWIDSGNIYVKTDGSEPDVWIVQTLTGQTNPVSFRNANLFMKGIEFIGLQQKIDLLTGYQSGTTHKYIDCKFSFDNTGDQVTVRAVGFDNLIAFKRCVFANFGGDGMNYSNGGTYVEEDCRYYLGAYGSGAYAGTSSAQASTAHSTANVVRIGGNYAGNSGTGQAIADIDNSDVWMIASTVTTEGTGQLLDLDGDNFYLYKVTASGSVSGDSLAIFADQLKGFSVVTGVFNAYEQTFVS